ncbi:MAG TPA: thiamine pyrophosphate-dependent enzyme, partial [Acidimicrobiales bacterium]|nr:thiamine pyrophosphate-dependent enzyme [Acidimicrobiales bacterium]
MYRTVLLARLVDQKAWNLTRTGKARFYIPAEGQEATQVGSAWALRAGHDIALPYYRDVGVVLSLGMTPYEVLLAVLAKGDDPNTGARQMPNHWGSKRLGIITGSSPIGTQFPHAAGLALASSLRGDDRVTVTWFGEAASSKGDFHEALNFAGIHHLPAVFVCENNGYAISVGMKQQSAVPDVADRAAAYGFDGVVVDGNDILDVYAATQAAVARARAGKGPTLVEAKTYRLMPHTTDDEDRIYRSREEVKAARTRDPLPRLERYVVEQGLLSREEVARIEQAAKEEVSEAARQAEAAAPPDPATAPSRVYARPREAAPERVVPPAGGVERTVVDTVRQTLHDVMATDERVMVLGEDVGVLGGVFRATRGLQEAYGDGRVIDTPLAESSIVGIGIGLALAGMRPVAEIQFADFMHSTFDQMVSEAAKIHYRSNGDYSVPLVVRTPWGAGG